MAILKNLNYIKAAQYFGCAEPNPALIIEAAATAAFPVLINAITFGCADIVRMRAGVSPWHARNMKALIEGAVPAEKAPGFKPLYKFLIPAEKALFFMFVVDLTEQFLAGWHSQIFKLGGCGFSVDQCSWNGDDPTWVCPGSEIPSTVSYTTVAKDNPACTTSGLGFSVPAGWYWSAFFDFTPQPIHKFLPISTVKTWIQRRGTSFYNYPPQDNTPVWYSNKIAASYKKTGHNKTSHYQEFWFMASADNPAYAASGSAYFSASSVPLDNQDIIPVNCFGAPVPGIGPHT